jgi:hypothetical protein
VVPLSAPNVHKLLVAYLTPDLTNVGIKMFPEDGPDKTGQPFYLLRRVTGADNWVTDYPVVSLHTFHTDIESCEDAALAAHDLMHNLTAKETITFGGVDHSVDLVETIEFPKWVDYANDNLERYVGRYRIHLRIITF